ncbi:hypothetical protein MZK49_00630 [Ensifer sesbaniae]|uniref:hypothetical protein n=1 Tax=Ensifer sesbaniae TaxID=1214071 RepID=UPI00200095FD|nr:hypothetical protein [Ensifer sesbaniae]
MSYRDPQKTAAGLSVHLGTLTVPKTTGVFEDDDGYVLVFIDARPGQPIRLNEFSDRPGLAEVAAHFLYHRGLTQDVSTRKAMKKLLRYFWRYLSCLEERFGVDVRSIEDIEQHVLDGYQDYLDGDEKYRSKLNLKEAVRRARYNFVTDMCRWSLASEKFAKRANDLFFKPFRWKGGYRKSESAEALNAIEVARLRAVCKREISDIRTKLDIGMGFIGSTPVPNLDQRSRVPFRAFAAKVAAFAEVTANFDLSTEQLRQRHVGLGSALKKPSGSIEEIVDHLFLTARTLIPFVVLLGLETGYNTGVLLNLEQGDIADHPLWPNTIRIAPKKSRAGDRRQVRTFEKDGSDPFSVYSLIESVKKIVSRYAPSLDADREHLFLVWSGMGNPPRKLVASDRKVETRFYRAIAGFCRDHEVEGLSLAGIRQTFADLVHLISNGDVIAIKEMMGHTNAQTADRHYNSAAAKKRRSEQLARGLRDRQRTIDSAGLIELREHRRGLPTDASTPGFLCWEPYYSPQIGQKDGRLCSAYGGCPDCPLSCAVTDDPVTAARFLQLKARLETAREKIDPIRWAVQWQSQFEALDSEWLRAVPPAVLAAAGNIHDLAPIPEIE